MINCFIRLLGKRKAQTGRPHYMSITGRLEETVSFPTLVARKSNFLATIPESPCKSRQCSHWLSLFWAGRKTRYMDVTVKAPGWYIECRQSCELQFPDPARQTKSPNDRLII